MKIPKPRYVTKSLEVTYLVLDFSSNPELQVKFSRFQIENNIYPVREIGGFSGQYKEAYCYSKENADRIVSWLQHRL